MIALRFGPAVEARCQRKSRTQERKGGEALYKRITVKHSKGKQLNEEGKNGYN